MNVPSNLIPTRIPQLPIDPAPSANGWLIYTNNGITYRVQVSDVVQVSGVPLERQVIAGTGLSGGGQLTSNVTLSVTPNAIGETELSPTGVVAGTYGSGVQVPVLAVDGTGRITSVSLSAVEVIGYVPITRQVVAGNGLLGGGPLNADQSLSADYSSDTPLSLSEIPVPGVATTLSRSDHVHPSVNLADTDQVTGILDLQNGGTNNSLVPEAGGIVWSGADGLYIGAQGQLGQVLISGATGEPTWGNMLTISDQAPNLVYASPASGGVGPTSFRSLANADFPLSGVVAGTYGSSSVVPVLTVDDKGLVTGVTDHNIAINWASITDTPTTLAGYGITDAEPAFAKNTAFNKNFGAITDTVTQGDDVRLSDDRVPLEHGSDKHSDDYQELLVSGVNIKTVSGNSLLGSANIEAELETGFSTNNTVVQVYDPIARTVTLSGVGKMYFKGAEILDVSLGYVSPPHPDTVGGWFHWYDGTDYVWTPYPWPFKDAAMIIYVNYGAVDRFGIREVHGQLPWEAHQEFHEQIGTYRRSGGDVIVVTGSDVTADKQPTVAQTILADEDLPSTLPALGKGAYTHFYLSGAGDVAFSLANPHIASIDGGSGRVQYNQDVGGTWQFTTINVNNNFHVVYLVGIPTTSDATSQAYRYIFFQGQQLYTTLATAQEATFEQLDTSTFALLASEWTVLEKFILRTSNTNNGWTVESSERVITNRAQALIGGAGVTSHTLLEDRDALDQHPQSAITGLVSDLSGKEPVFTKNTAFNKNFGAVVDTVTQGNDTRLSDARTPTNHNLINTTNHPVSGLTAGHFIRATDATTYAFAAIQAADVPTLNQNTTGTATPVSHDRTVHSDIDQALLTTSGVTFGSIHNSGRLTFTPPTGDLDTYAAWGNGFTHTEHGPVAGATTASFAVSSIRGFQLAASSYGTQQLWARNIHSGFSGGISPWKEILFKEEPIDGGVF